MAKRAQKKDNPQALLADMVINHPPDNAPSNEAEVCEYYYQMGLLKQCSGNCYDRTLQSGITLVGIYYYNCNSLFGCQNPPQNPTPEELAQYYIQNGNEIPSERLTFANNRIQWDADDLVTAYCETGSGANNNTLRVAAIYEKANPSGPPTTYVDEASIGYRGICVTCVQAQSALVSAQKGLSAGVSQWHCFSGIPATQKGPGVRLEVNGSPLHAEKIEVMACNVDWSWKKPIPMSVYRASGATLRPSGPGWYFPDIPEGSIVIWQNLHKRLVSTVSAQTSRLLPELTEPADTFELIPGLDIYAQVNFPVASLAPAQRSGSFGLMVRKIR